MNRPNSFLFVGYFLSFVLMILKFCGISKITWFLILAPSAFAVCILLVLFLLTSVVSCLGGQLECLEELFSES